MNLAQVISLSSDSLSILPRFSIAGNSAAGEVFSPALVRSHLFEQ